jgi:PEP-CTERM motif
MKKLSKFALRGALCLATCVQLISPTYATTMVDPAGDFLPSYTGPQNADLDVLSIAVGIQGSFFKLDAMLGGPIGTTAGGLYVWGVNRGAGTAGFAANDPGLNKVLFDSVVILDNLGGGRVVQLGVPGFFSLASGAVTISGNSISALVPFGALPTRGLDFEEYGFNLWPRGTGGGFANISDFAPNNATIAAIPEPVTWMMMLVGFGAVGHAVRRRRKVKFAAA